MKFVKRDLTGSTLVCVEGDGDSGNRWGHGDGGSEAGVLCRDCSSAVVVTVYLASLGVEDADSVSQIAMSGFQTHASVVKVKVARVIRRVDFDDRNPSTVTTEISSRNPYVSPLASRKASGAQYSRLRGVPFDHENQAIVFTKGVSYALDDDGSPTIATSTVLIATPSGGVHAEVVTVGDGRFGGGDVSIPLHLKVFCECEGERRRQSFVKRREQRRGFGKRFQWSQWRGRGRRNRLAGCRASLREKQGWRENC